MNTDNKELAEAVDAAHSLTLERLELQQRIAELEKERIQVVSDTWYAAEKWLYWQYYEELNNKLMPKHMRENRPPHRMEYLSQFEQTKTENI